MEVQRHTGVSNFRLFDRDQEIGFIDGRRVGFRGFASATDAAAAAWAATREPALRDRNRPGIPLSAEDAELIVVEGAPGQMVAASCHTLASLFQTPGDGISSEPGDWRFEIEVPMDAGPELFVVAQARIMWRGICARGIERRMAQFAATVSA